MFFPRPGTSRKAMVAICGTTARRSSLTEVMDGATLQFMQQVCLTSGPDTMGHWEQGDDGEEEMVEVTPRHDGYDIGEL
jgi:hypothetical protein